MQGYDVRVKVGDVVCNRVTGCTYRVKGVEPSPVGTLVVGLKGAKPQGKIQDVILEDSRGEERTAAAVSGYIMSEFWEVVR